MLKASFFIAFLTLIASANSYGQQAKKPFPVCPGGLYVVTLQVAPEQGQQVAAQLSAAGVNFPINPQLPELPNPSFHQALTIMSAQAQSSSAIQALRKVYDSPAALVDCDQTLIQF